MDGLVREVSTGFPACPALVGPVEKPNRPARGVIASKGGNGSGRFRNAACAVDASRDRGRITLQRNATDSRRSRQPVLGYIYSSLLSSLLVLLESRTRGSLWARPAASSISSPSASSREITRGGARVLAVAGLEAP